MKVFSVHAIDRFTHYHHKNPTLQFFVKINKSSMDLCCRPTFLQTRASELILCNFFSPFARAFVRKYVTRLRLVFIYTTIKPFVTSETFSEITPARREIIIDNFATTIGQESSFHTLIIFLSHSRWFILLIGKQKCLCQFKNIVILFQL